MPAQRLVMRETSSPDVLPFAPPHSVNKHISQPSPDRTNKAVNLQSPIPTASSTVESTASLRYETDILRSDHGVHDPPVSIRLPGLPRLCWRLAGDHRLLWAIRHLHSEPKHSGLLWFSETEGDLLWNVPKLASCAASRSDSACMGDPPVLARHKS